MATTNNKAELRITISDETKKAAQATSDLYNRIDAQGGFKTERGGKVKSQVGGNLKVVDQLRNQPSLSKTEYEGFRKALHTAAKARSDYAATITTLSAAAQQLQTQLNTLSQKYNKASDKLSAAQTQQNQAIQDINSQFNNTKIYKLKKNGELYKNPITLQKSLELYSQDPNKFESNTVLKTGDKIETLSASGKQPYFDAYVKSTAQVDKLTDALKRLETQVDQVQASYKAQRTKDQTSGAATGTNVDLVADSQQNAITVDQTTATDLNAAQSTQNSQAIVSLNQSIQKQQSLLTKAAKAFTIYSVVIRAARSALREAAKTVAELDKSLTEQARVTGRNREQAYELLSTYQNLAQTIGATTKEVAEAASEFIKQGKSIEDALTLSKAAVSAAKVAGISVSDSINYITTALNGFQLSAEEAMDVSDKFAAIAAASASDYNEIAIALSKVASQANLAGRSIDYTTALLTTGLEVTREAPETMGTALKTIIARRREISDYGETLEDGVDLNNVQTQLSYIGIQLTNQQGELRSTEDVLDELGKKWSTLNSNQQAAVAKALAGTRQQSRLIAMMDNYERVEELQQISERSAGATAAQLTKYRDGLEAARNNIRVAWEKVVETLVNSDFIIGLVNAGTSLLNVFNELAKNKFIQGTLFTALGAMAASLIAKKKIANDLAKEELQLRNQEKIAQLQARQAQIEDEAAKTVDQDIQEKKTARDNAQAALDELEAKKNGLEAAKELEIAEQNRLATAKKQTIEDERQAKLKERSAKMSVAQSRIESGDSTKVQHGLDLVQTNSANIANINAEAEKKLAKVDAEKTSNITAINQRYKTAEAQIQKDIDAQKEKLEAATEAYNQANASRAASVQTLIDKNKEYAATEDALQLLQAKGNSLLSGSLTLYAAKKTLLGGRNALTSLLNKTAFLSIGLTKKDAAANAADTVAKGANTVATGGLTAAWHALTAAMKANPIGAILVALTAVAAGITWLVKKIIDSLPTLKNVSKSIGEITNEIYELNKSNTAIETALSKWDEYDEKLIKTKADAESLTESLDQVTDSLTEQQQKAYKAAQTDAERIRLLKQFKQENDRAIQQNWETASLEIASMSEGDLRKALGNVSGLSDEEAEQATTIQNAVYARANYQWYQAIDKNVDALGKAKDAVEDLGESIISNLSAERVYDLAKNGGIGLNQLMKSLKAVGNQIDNLASGEGSLKSRVADYQAISAALYDDKDALAAFQDQYQQYSVFETMSDDLLDLIDSMSISDDTLNSLYAAYKNLTDENGNQLISGEEYHARFSNMLQTFQATQDVAETIKSTFGDIVSNLNDEDTWDKFVSIFDDLEVSSLTIGQNIDSLTNKIAGFYEKASSWSTRSESDKAEFINNNAGRFQGEDGQTLIEAFRSGDYDTIQQALRSNDNLEQLRKQRLQEVDTALAIELARSKKTRNQALIEELQLEKKHLEDVNDLYAVSLKTRLEQEQNQLSEFKSYLQDEEDAITDSLNKRKEAYNKYFDAINEAASDEEYEKTANLYRENLTKLGSSTDASAVSQRADLESKLQDLEDQHLEDLRSRAQDAIISNIDTEISDISDKFDDLLDSSQKRLELRQSSMSADNGAFFSNLISNELYKGATANEAQQYLSDLQSTFANRLGNVDLSDIKISQDGQALVLNVNGQTYNLDTSSQQSLYKTIRSALRQLGVK